MLVSEDQIGCEIYIPDSKESYKAFYSNKDAIEKELGLGALSWQELPEKKASRIRLTRQFDVSSQKRDEAFAWLVDATVKFKSVFSKDW
jgi:hypothetical protein